MRNLDSSALKPMGTLKMPRYPQTGYSMKARARILVL